MITFENGARRYFDKHGREIVKDSIIRYPSGVEERVYETDQGELGTDATSPGWIVTDRAVPCEFGIFPLTKADTDIVEVIG